ncbi:MAG: hypothetical protein ACXAB7_15305 [Candidatus Kariarchaeaceae archaeon]|jgi:hypothetical protein
MNSTQSNENSITARYGLHRKDYMREFIIKDQNGQKLMEGRSELGFSRKRWRESRKKDKKDRTLFSIQNVHNEPMGEICVPENSKRWQRWETPRNIKDANGEVLAKISFDINKLKVIIETPSNEFNSELVTRTIKEEFNWRGKRKHVPLWKAIMKIDIVDKEKKKCFSICPTESEFWKKNMFEIILYKGSFDLIILIVSAASFLMANLFWPVRQQY